MTVSYDWRAPDELGGIVHTIPVRATHEWSPAWRDGIARLRQYDPWRRDPLANRALSTGHLFAGREKRAALAQAREQLWNPLGVHFQLRAALYEGSRFIALVAVLRSRGDGEYDEDDERLLASLAGPLRDAFAIDRARRAAAKIAPGIESLFEAFDSAAFLLDARGRLVHANAIGRALGAPPWLALAKRRGGRDRLLAHARVIDVQLDGAEHVIVVARRPTSPPSRSIAGSIPPLPPRVLEVARRVAAGEHVSDIAEAMRLTPKSVRTYLERAHTLLDVHNRAELVRKLHGVSDP